VFVFSKKSGIIFKEVRHLRIIITGFKPFMSHDVNPTEEIISILPGQIYGNEIIRLLLPVEFDNSFDVLKEAIIKYKPNVVIALGLAGNRKAISLERVAINVDHSTAPDNIGNTPNHKTIIKSGMNAYFSTLPLDDIVLKLKQKNINVEISNTAGTYVCNNLFYHLMNYIEENNLNIKAGFVHVPLMDEQLKSKGNFSMPLSTMVEGVIDLIKECI